MAGLPFFCPPAAAPVAGCVRFHPRLGSSGESVATTMKLESTAQLERPKPERLTPQELIKLDIFPPPPPLVPYVTTFFRLCCDEAVIRDVQPSSIGLMAAMARGGGHMRFIDGRVEPSHRFTLQTPTAAASTFEVEGPWHLFGAALAPLGWAALTGLSATEHGNRLYDGAELLGSRLVEAASTVADDFDRLSSAEMVDLFSTAILASLSPVKPMHVRFVETVAAWLAGSLSPNVADLEARCGYGKRQVQRLAERFFGLPPTALARKYRALRAAVLLSRPGLSADEIAAVQDHFYDQPHMIREIRLFAGRTPARIADPDTPYLSALMDVRNFRGRGSRLAPIPEDLRA
jgi:AraC-like DNA-binding protein